MKDITLEGIYADLKKNITAARLKEISIAVIRHYREKNAAALSRYAALLGIETGEDTLSRLFSRIIQRCHPDRLITLHREIDRWYGSGGIEELRRIHASYLFREPPVSGWAPGAPAEPEEYIFGEDDFGYDEKDLFGDEPIDEFEYDGFIHDAVVERGGDVLGAIQDLFVGNLDYTLSMSDLNNLEGELDLSDCDIANLENIEHCVNVSGLNLSGNRLRRIKALSALERLESLFLADNEIETIDGLAALLGLRELDISFNRVEDITALLEMKELAYVNLMENPVKTVGVIQALRDKGVIVIF